VSPALMNCLYLWKSRVRIQVFAVTRGVAGLTVAHAVLLGERSPTVLKERVTFPRRPASSHNAVTAPYLDTRELSVLVGLFAGYRNSITGTSFVSSDVFCSLSECAFPYETFCRLKL
jgi:hypothetical protein